MPANNIVIGQKIDPIKAQRARELRRNMTLEERMLWQAVRRNQLGGYHFRRQQVIEGFIADFYCHAARLVVEIDGEIHQTQTHYDDARDQVLVARGLRVLRISNTLVRENLPAVLTLILSTCQKPNSPSLSGKGPGVRSDSPSLSVTEPGDRLDSPSLARKRPGVRS